mmetsp:Transcript_18133/g.30980  ORF Transcript_18133/g.30980 Transcript_18133/m.30980 type:complete len:96 (+) Transcript_18133:448-735(+)
MRTKARVERDIVEQAKIPHMAIYKPGLLLNRDNDFRVGEKLASFIPFVDTKIESADLAKAMLSHAFESLKGAESGVQSSPVFLSNAELRAQASKL